MTKEKQLFKIKSEVVFDKCTAMRCQNAPVGHADAGPWGHPGLRVPLCERHLKEAGVVTTEGETVSSEATAVPESASTEIVATGGEAEAFVTVTLADADETLELLASMEVETQEDLELVSELLRDVKTKAKEIEAKEKSITRPMREKLDNVYDVFRPAKEKLVELERVLKAKILEVMKSQDQDNAKALEEAASAHASGDKEAASEAVTKVKHVSELSGITPKKKWVYKIVDASKVERRFLAVHDSAVREYIKSFDGKEPTATPGLEFYEESSIAARAN